MGKSKKPFIDRKNAVTFHLVHRSQRDPLVTDETAPQHVLVEAKPKVDPDDMNKRKTQQQKFGIFFDDDYDYLQHLRESTKDVVWEYVETPNQQKSKKNHVKASEIQLPSSVFATEFEEDEGMLNKAAPCPGPKPDWDPDVVAALDDDFDYDNPANQLDDDFVFKAMGDEENAVASEDDMEFDERDEDEEDVDSDGPMYDDYDDKNELNDRLGPLMRKYKNFNDEETKSRFTEYSLSSSVIRRNEQLQLLDERFEKFFAQYDDPEIGPLDMEDIEGHMGQKHPMLLDCYRLYKKKTDCDKYDKQWDKERIKKYIDEGSSVGDEDDEFVEMEVQDEKQKKWDCQSMLSTYSNIYNHPKLIEEPRKHKQKDKIEIDPKTGIPMNVLRGNNSDKLTLKTLAKLDMENDMEEHPKLSGPKSLCAKSVISTLSVLSIRPKDEKPEEKKERKKLLKEYRAERRIERKANAEAFKEEKKRQQHIKINNQNNIQGNRIL